MPYLPKVEINSGNNKQKIVFLSGFPDNQTSGWGKELPAAFSEDFHLIFFCLPGFEKDSIVRKWGYDFDEILDMLDDSISALCESNEKVVLMCHDWGAYVGSLYQNKYSSRVKKLVLFDVGFINPYAITLHSSLIIASYQLWFAVAYFLSQTLHSLIGTFVFYSFFIPIFKPLWPTMDKVHVPFKALTVEKCYPYYYFWRRIIFSQSLVPKFPTCPLLYLVSFFD